MLNGKYLAAPQKFNYVMGLFEILSGILLQIMFSSTLSGCFEGPMLEMLALETPYVGKFTLSHS